MELCERETVTARERAETARGTTERELMYRASAALGQAAVELTNCRRAILFCGFGKNGGDGYGAARFLRSRGVETIAFCVGGGERDKLAREFERLYIAEGGAVVRFEPSVAARLCAGVDVVIDAIFGVGFRGAMSGEALAAAEVINRSNRFVISADLPSGVECDSALFAEGAVRADATVAFGCAKPAHYIQPSKSLCGKVVVADIGISKEIEHEFCSNTRLVDEDFIAERLKPRRADSHKGDYGKVLIVGGSRGFAGAPCLAAEGALRSGAGIVFLAAPECVYPIMAGFRREAVCLPFESCGDGYAESALEPLLSRAEKCGALVLGPGLGRSEQSDRIALGLIERARCPLLLDADGINAAAENINILRGRRYPTVVTPHDVEFSRLGGTLGGGRLGGARALAKDLGAVVVLKGNSTVTACPDGRAFVNSTGNPGMAKGGSGDVLAGVVGSLLGQGLSPEDAAAVGAWLHGRAGDLAADELGECGMTPSDLCARLPHASRPFVARD